MRIASSYAAIAKAELLRAGVTAYTFEMGDKHPRLVFVHNGRPRVYVLPGSPSDHRGPLNMRTDLRRMLGLVAEKIPPRERRRQKRCVPDAPPPMPAMLPRPDPFAVLAVLLQPDNDPGSSNGRTADFDSANRGSNP